LPTCTQRNLHWHCKRISFINNSKWMPIHSPSNLHTRWCWTKRSHNTNHKEGTFSMALTF
jgi:hypothetical protein